MTPKTFTEMLADRIAAVELAISRIERRDDAEVALLNMRDHLIDIFALIERHPGIEAAADDLYKTAEALIGRSGVARDPRQLRLFRDAHLRFRDRIGSAKPRGAKQ